MFTDIIVCPEIVKFLSPADLEDNQLSNAWHPALHDIAKVCLGIIILLVAAECMPEISFQVLFYWLMLWTSQLTPN